MRRLSYPALILAACAPDVPLGPVLTSEPSTTATTPTTGAASTTTGLWDDGQGDLDLPPPPDTEDLPGCSADGTCNQIDILIVVDNSETMAAKQRQLAADIGLFVALLRALKDREGVDVDPDVNVHVTTTDMTHPACNDFIVDGYVPAKGAPQTEPCLDRLSHFTPFGGVPSLPETCTDVCSSPAAPTGSYVHFTKDTSNVDDPDGMGDPAADALACLVPQGIDGCFYEAPLEAMLQALDPGKQWNKGPAPFLRTGATLAIIFLTDESDCSIKDHAYFDPENADDPEITQYWPASLADPDLPGEPNSSVCWRAGLECADADADHTYETCTPVDHGVLQPIHRYTDYLHEVLIKDKRKDVAMLVLGGVPPVTAHADTPPFQPITGGLADLVFRDWTGDDLFMEDTNTAEQLQFDYGVAPGCNPSADRRALPPGRMIDVCRSLDLDDQIRCCVESACDTSYQPALTCLVGVLSQLKGIPG